MAKPRKKIPTGPTKDDLLSRLGAAFQRQIPKSSSASQDQDPSQGEQSQVIPASDPDSPSDPPEIQQELLHGQGEDEGIQDHSDEDQGVGDQNAEDRSVPDQQDQDVPDQSELPIEARADQPQAPADPPSDPAVPESDPLSAEDVALWLESAGSAEAADLMEAMEQIESEELGEEVSVTPGSTSADPPGPLLVETMLDDLLSALQLDDEDELPVEGTPTQKRAVDSTDQTPDLSPAQPQEQTPEIQAADRSLPPPVHAALPKTSHPQPEPSPSQPEILSPPETLTLELSPEATHRLNQIRAESGALPEILVDVIIRHWHELPDWAQQKHLGLAHQIRVEQILAGQQRTIQSIERLLAGDPGD